MGVTHATLTTYRITGTISLTLLHEWISGQGRKIGSLDPDESL